jgi:hypothetical protein
MELKKNFGEEEGVILGDVGESTQFRISTDSQSIIIDSLINLYEDPIGSIVREITSNCVDAHRERDLKLLNKRALEKDDDVKYFSNKNVVEVEYITGNSLLGIKNAIVFTDHGVGLSDERVKETYTVFGSSTKRVDNYEIGGFGLGSKSVFAYSDTFFVDTRKNGVRRVYLLSRGTSFPTMDLVYTEKTKELNGTKIIVPLKSYYDASKFVDAINRQLTYFPNVIFSSFENIGNIKKADILFETDDFLIDKNSDYSGILIGNVQYPINTDLLDNIYVPSVGIKYKFEIGVLDLVPSREAIRYTEETKKLIKNKINKVKEFAKKYIKDKLTSETNFVSLITKIDEAHQISQNSYYGYRSYYRNYYTDSANTPISKDQQIFNNLCRVLDRLNLDKIKYKDLEFDVKDGINFSELFCGFTFYLLSDQTTKKGGKSRRIEVTGTSYFSYDLYKITGNFYRVKDLVIFEKTPKVVVFREVPIKLDPPRNFKSGDDYTEKLNELTKLNEKVKQYFYESIKYSDYDAIVPSVKITSKNTIDWEAERKKNGEIFYRYLRDDSTYYYKLSWANGQKKLNDIKFDDIIYGYDENKDKLEFLPYIVKGTKYSLENIWKIAKANKKYFENSAYVEDFFNSENKILKEYFTLNINRELIRSLSFLRAFKEINISIHSLFVVLEDKLDKVPRMPPEIETKLLEYCKCSKEDLIDNEIISILDILKKYTDDLTILKYIPDLENYNFNNDELKNSIKKLLTFYNKEIKETI